MSKEEILGYLFDNNIRFKRGIYFDLPETIRDSIDDEARDLNIEQTTDLKSFASYLFDNSTNVDSAECQRIAKYLIEISQALEEKYTQVLLTDDSQTPLFKQFPELLPHIDAAGLISSTELERFNLGFKYKGYHIAFDDRIDWDQQKLLETHMNRGTEVLIRLSRLPPIKENDYREEMRKARDFGRPFAAERLNRKLFAAQKELTVFTRPQAPEEGYAYIGLSNEERFEILRTERDLISFMTENIPSTSPPIPQLIETRMFHSDIEVSATKFNHIDSSALFYSPERFQERRAKTLQDKVKAQFKVKLFKIDKAISIAEWSDFLISCYPLNELPREYIFDRVYPEGGRNTWGF